MKSANKQIRLITYRKSSIIERFRSLTASHVPGHGRVGFDYHRICGYGLRSPRQRISKIVSENLNSLPTSKPGGRARCASWVIGTCLSGRVSISLRSGSLAKKFKIKKIIDFHDFLKKE